MTNRSIFNKKLLFVFALFFASNLTAQSFEQSKDSLLNLLSVAKHDTTRSNLYYTLSKLLADNDFTDISKKHALKAIKYAQKAKDTELEQKGYQILAYNYILAAAPSDTLFFYINLFEKKAKKAGGGERMTNVYRYKAFSFMSLNRIDKALIFYLKALDNVRKYKGDKKLESDILHNIGLVYADKGSYANALKYLREADKLGSEINRGNIFFNTGLVYLELENIDSAFILSTKALTFFEQTKDISGIISVKAVQAVYYQKKGDNKTAEKRLKEALALSEKYKIEDKEVHNDLMVLHVEQKQFDKAIYHGERALNIAKKEDDFYFSGSIYPTLHNAYAQLGNFSRAYEVLYEYTVFKDSTDNLEMRSRVETLTTEFEVKQKETENKLLKAEKAAAEKTLRSRNATLLAMFFGLIFLGGWAFFIYRANQQKKKYNEILEQKVAERTAELESANKNLEQANYELRTFNYIASHDIKEPIRNVGNYAGLIFRKLPQELKTDLQDYFDIIKRSTAQLYTLVEDFARYTTLSKNDKVELRKIDLNDLIGSITTDLTETIKKYGGQVVISPLPIIESNNSLLYPAFKNLIENGLKYNQSETPTVQVSHRETDTHHEIHIKDNGIGIEPQYHAQIFEMFKRLHDRSKYEGSGIGLAITKLTVKKLGGDILLESEAQKGSDFVVRLPKNL